MLLQPSGREPFRQPELPAESDVLSSITTDMLRQHLGELSELDRRALLDTLIPHRHLPTYHPAGYIIAYHDALLGKDAPPDPDAGDLEAKVDVSSSYDLGVVFGCSLYAKTLKDGKAVPPITDFNQQNLSLVETYLEKSHHQTVKKLGSNDNKNLANALDVFIARCRTVVPDLVFDESDAGELRRGCHDYLSIVALLEADQSQQPSLLRRFLGRSSILQLFSHRR